MMKYKGYVGHVTYDDEGKVFHGEVLGINDVITFQGQTVQELEDAFRDSVEDYLSFCAERGEMPEKPYSGKFNLRIPPEMHARLAIEARRRNESINSYLVKTIEDAIAVNHKVHKRI